MAVAGAFALTFTAFISQHFLRPRESDRWLRARSVSEGVKSEIFRFRAGAHPYDVAPSDDGDPALDLLLHRVGEIEAMGADLDVYLPAMPRRSSMPPGALTPSGYLESRVKDQIEGFYQPKSRENMRKARLYRAFSVAAAAVAVAISTLTALDILQELGAWVAVATTIGASFVAYSNVNRFEALAIAYAKQAGELRRLSQAWQVAANSNDEPDWSDFVKACEEAISTENKAWMARMANEVQGVADVIRDGSAGRV